MKWVRGLWLLIAGTVSIAVFLHTMRFKKLLPPRVTFSCYLIMAYASFSGERATTRRPLRFEKYEICWTQMLNFCFI